MFRNSCCWVFTICFLLCAGGARAQLIVADSLTATQLVNKLIGNGIVVLNPTLGCPGIANGEFKISGTSNLGIDSGAVLTTGRVVTTSAWQPGVNAPAGVSQPQPSNFSNGDTMDADLLKLVPGLRIRDVCKLEFDFISKGSQLKFDYVFGSAEYRMFSCTRYNDVFGFFITGPGYTGATNIATIPGTAVPVAVNSTTDPAINVPTSLADCLAMGPGSPFAQYYVNNNGGTSVSYWGFTKVFTASALVNPCDTYHFKLVIADGGDAILDSGVFLKSGSFSSDTIEVHSARDTTFCYQGMFPAVTLKVREGEERYLWDNGATGFSRIINNSGIYWVQHGDCRLTVDTFIVDGRQAPDNFSIGNDTLICEEYGLVTLQAPIGNYTYLWENGDTSRSLTTDAAGRYAVTVTRNGCSTSDTMQLNTRNCTCTPFVPNAFTPNNDGRNDYFKPSVLLDCLPADHYVFRIVNRWGNVVYSSFSETDKGWDGNFRGQRANAGTYFYYLDFTSRYLKQSFRMKGDLTLIR